jgi:D-alanine-D-alanine ligase
MMKINKHIEIVASSLPGINCMSPKAREAIRAILSEEYVRVGITIVDNLRDLAALAAMTPDMVFLGMKCIPSNPELGLSDPNKIWLSEYLDERGISYTGSGHAAVEFELNKELAKQCITDAGLRTAPFQVVRKNERLTQDNLVLSYPLFVKPTDRGGGVGVDAGSLVYNFGQLHTKIESLSARLQTDSLVEEYLPGREFSVAILKEAHTDQYSVIPIHLGHVS